MKKHMTRNIILMLVLDVVLGIVLALYISSTGTVPAADNADTYTDGTYTASAQGCLSEGYDHSGTSERSIGRNRLGIAVEESESG